MEMKKSWYNLGEPPTYPKAVEESKKPTNRISATRDTTGPHCIRRPYTSMDRTKCPTRGIHLRAFVRTFVTPRRATHH